MKSIKSKYWIVIFLGLLGAIGTIGTIGTKLSFAHLSSFNTSPSAPSVNLDLAQSNNEMALLTAMPNSRINIRRGPGTEFNSVHYGLAGDRVTILESVRATPSEPRGRYWYRVRFQQSRAEGWVRGDFLIKTTESVSNLCHESLAQARTELNNVNNGFLNRVILQRNSLSPIRERPNQLILGLGGSGEDEVLSSERLMKPISDRLIQNCGNVSSVQFGSGYSGWHHVYGLIDGRVSIFKCADFDPSSGRQLRWGEYNCNI
jgi:Bacterial SH3 domain